MSIRDTIARWLSPNIARKAERYHWLRSEIDECWRWLSTYQDVSEAMQRLLERDKDHWRKIDEMPVGQMPSDIRFFREVLERRQNERWKEWTALRDVAYQLGDNCVPGNIDILEQIAGEIDCQPGCDRGYTEHDTNAFVCGGLEDGDCGSDKAEQLRSLANAFRNRQRYMREPGQPPAVQTLNIAQEELDKEFLRGVLLIESALVNRDFIDPQKIKTAGETVHMEVVKVLGRRRLENIQGKPDIFSS